MPAPACRAAVAALVNPLGEPHAPNHTPRFLLVRDGPGGRHRRRTGQRRDTVEDRRHLEGHGHGTDRQLEFGRRVRHLDMAGGDRPVQRGRLPGPELHRARHLEFRRSVLDHRNVVLGAPGVSPGRAADQRVVERWFRRRRRPVDQRRSRDQRPQRLCQQCQRGRPAALPHARRQPGRLRRHRQLAGVWLQPFQLGADRRPDGRCGARARNLCADAGGLGRRRLHDAQTQPR